LELNGTHQLLLYDDDDDVNMLSQNTNTIKENTEALILASREVGLEVNTENTKHKVMSLHQNAGQNQNLLIAKSPLKMWQSSHTREQK
jgi:hypothetical protein